jgi:single-stranded-DNA-specific exonuclease
MEKRWVIKERPDHNLVQQLSQQLNINHSLSSLLIQRGIDSFDAAKDFFRPKLTDLHDPFLMKDMDLAVNRLIEAVSRQERIIVYGDYDVDGTTSVALVYSFLRRFTNNIEYYIPDRYKEGYGVSFQGIEYAAATDTALIVALDCGIKAIDTVNLANQYGIDFIICDHHRPGDQLPEALAVLDPKRDDCEYPFKELSGCGVGFKLLQGFCLQNTIDEAELFSLLDLVAVSIASDIVPIVGENRVLAYYGLKKLNAKPIPGLKSLIDVAGMKPPIDISNIVFQIGPRINAAGRLAHAKESVKLLVSDDPEELRSFSSQLNTTNLDRREYDSTMTQEALELIDKNESFKVAKSTVLFKDTWHKGVIGIVASRCTEHYYRPTIILTKSKDKATGSARSVEGFDIYNAIDQCADLLDQYGGHTHAAGLTLPIEKIDDFRRRFEEVVAATINPEALTPKLDIDLVVPLRFASFKTLSILNQMRPFGPHNMHPVFVSEQVTIKSPPLIMKERHAKLYLYEHNNSQVYEAVGWGMAEQALKIPLNSPFSIAYAIEENNYQGNKTIQLNIKDIKFYD